VFGTTNFTSTIVILGDSEGSSALEKQSGESLLEDPSPRSG